VSSNLSPDSTIRQAELLQPEITESWGPSLQQSPGSREWVIPGVLFAATLLSTSYVGLLYSGISPSIFGVLRNPFILFLGIPFSFPLLMILLAHEMGHFLACRYYRIRCTPPYFLPFPISIAGTMGAFIRIRSPFMHRRALFDVGIAGPLAGFVFVIPSLVIGIALSEIVDKGALDSGFYAFGEPLLFQWIGGLTLGYDPAAHDMIAHPIAMAGWFGLLVTCLNLLPIWQLDGGHIAYALLGREPQKKLSIVMAIALVLISFLGWPLPAYLLFGVILLVLGARFRFYHPPTVYEDEPIGAGRMWLSLLALAILVTSFTPTPFYLT
jgi:membrane-associated protease RseP (regulator of RpoE activity)